VRQLGALLLLLALALPARAADVSGLDWEQRLGAQLPMDAPLVDASGGATTLREVAGGRPLILAPGYFKCPNLCGVIRDDLFAALAASGLRPGSDYRAALLTIDKSETPADARTAQQSVLDRYPGAAFAALTGPASSLADIAGAAGFPARYDEAAKQFLHPAGVVIATPSGAVSSYLMGVGYSAADIAAAVASAGAGTFRRAEPIHLFCFSYDPTTGRFTASVMEALRLAAVATVLAIGATLLVLGRRA